ncbi:hypothetical protein [Paraburkholderia diazotrophica]|uniref:Uncharacterized protein n=1 Tax=Paraburkholderia diazotrophica TaxID=667676 RepID=A0A1H7DKQ1_9BURK|nr:hypothetical protein [Paraburkholderia diazotrophica]SEK02369.1 hypothetical protein SAMN05192539_103157 [Paraburkholderia diazotrophica]
MTEQNFRCVQVPSGRFLATQATLGYSNHVANEPAVAERRGRYVAFSRQLHAVLAPLLEESYSLYEELTVLTSRGFAGPVIRADCVAVTNMGVFVISQVDWAVSEVSLCPEKNSLRVLTAPKTYEIYPNPLRYTAPAVHFLSAFLHEFEVPVDTLAVLNNETCDIREGVPTSFLKASELHHFFRLRRELASSMRLGFMDFREMGVRLRTGCRQV